MGRDGGFLLKYLVARPTWVDGEDYDIYVRGVNSERPHAWAKVTDHHEMYYEAQILCHNRLPWEFFDTMECAVRRLDKLNKGVDKTNGKREQLR